MYRDLSVGVECRCILRMNSYKISELNSLFNQDVFKGFKVVHELTSVDGITIGLYKQ